MKSPNDPNLTSWISVSKDSDFPIQNIPFGVFERPDGAVVCGSRLGDWAIDLSSLEQLGYFSGISLPLGTFSSEALNAFISTGRPVWKAVRERLSSLLSVDGDSSLRDHLSHRSEVLIPLDKVEMHMPVMVGDYTDFYASREHATNVGMMFRDPSNALLPNWLHLPVGYHGRSSTLVASGTPVIRPNGQRKGPNDPDPVFGPSTKLDFELEVGFFTTQGPEIGQWIPSDKAEEYIFGLVLFNDWSARDIQQWEYVPLGPFLGKNFASSLSPWVVLLDALTPFRTQGPIQNPTPLPYLHQPENSHVDIALQVSIAPEGGAETMISQTNFKGMYWSMAQQLAHHTVNGCAMEIGDLLASGTISGATPDSYGSLLELTWNGTKPLTLSDGSQRTFLNDGDTLTLRGHCMAHGVRIGFGEVTGKILPAKEWKA